MASTDLPRTSLPIPERHHVGLTTYDAKDPDTSYPPISRCGRRRARRTCWWCCWTTPGSARRARSAGRARRRRSSGSPATGSEVQSLPHDGAVLADAAGAADGPQPPRGRDGRHHRDRHLRAGVQLDPAGHGGAAGRDDEAQRLQHRAARQVPRGAGVGDEPDGAVQPVAARQRVRVLLRLRRRRDEPVVPGAVRRRDAGRAAEDARGGLPLHRGPGRQGDHLGRPAEVADARQAVLHVLRAGRDARARTTCPRSGATSTGAGSTTAGTRSGRRRSPARRSSA